MITTTAALTLAAGTSVFAAGLPYGAIDVEAGGPHPAAAAFHGAECDAWVEISPTHVFSVGDGVPFAVVAESDADTVLFVEGPDGGLDCSDDMYGRSPGIMLEDPAPGEYRIWLGTLRDTRAAATLLFLGLPDALRSSREADIVLRDGFDGETMAVVAGGYVATVLLGDGGCRGFVAAEPVLSFRYEAGRSSLHVGVDSPVDTTLVISGPGGELCSDDVHGHDPSIRIRHPGVYHAWVGAFAPASIGADADLVLAMEPVVGREGPSAPGLDGHGTGFSVSPDGHLLTNAHIVDGCERITARLPGRAGEEAHVIHTDEGIDLALIRVTSLRGPFVAISDDLPVRPGQEVGVLGYPGNDTSVGPTFTLGVVSSLTGYEGDWTALTHSAEVRSGSSGSPILDSSGNLVGIVSAKLSSRGREVSNVGFGTRAYVIELFLRTQGLAIPHGTATPQAWPGTVDQAISSVGVVSCWK